jgi:deaminated glutathione amidase
LYSVLSQAGATILSVPAAFTVPTGKVHWDVLLRARAIENACYVIAAAQSGHHEDGRETYGHSVVIDPWGETVLDMNDQIGLGFADLDLTLVDAVRARIPVIAHRKAIPAIVTIA